MWHGAAEINGMTGVSLEMRRPRAVNEAGGSAGMSVSNLLKALMGSARSNKRRFFL